MYFWVSVIFGLILLIFEVAAAQEVYDKLSNKRLSIKIGSWALIIISGLLVAPLFSLAEYNLISEEGTKYIAYSFPVLAGSTSGSIDLFSAFSIYAFIINLVIGFLFPCLLVGFVLRIYGLKLCLSKSG